MTTMLYVAWLRSHGRTAGATDDQVRRTAAWSRQAFGSRQVAAYRLTAGGSATTQLGTQPHHLEPPFHSRLHEPEAPDTLILAQLDGFADARSFHATLTAAEGAPADVVDGGAYVSLQEWVAEGVDGPWGPVVHFGTYETRSPHDEWALAEFYCDVRMPEFVRRAGALRSRRLANACGAPGRTAVLYEFASLEARLTAFEPLEVQPPAAAAQALTLHGALSPNIGTLVR